MILGTALVDEFEKRVATEKIQPYLRSELKRFSRYDKMGYASVVPTLLLLAMLYAPKIILRNVAWETIWERSYLSTGNIQGFWLDSESTWITYRNPFADNSEVVHITGDKKESWSIDKDNFYPDTILADSKNQPWIFGYDSYYHWVGSSWEEHQLKGYTLSSFSVPVVIDGTYWVVAHQEGTKLAYLVGLDLDSGEMTHIYPPEELIKDKYSVRSIKKSPDNSLYVMAAKPYGSVVFYVVGNGQWKRGIELKDVGWRQSFVFTPVERASEPEPILGVQDFVVDATGQVWLIMEKDGKWSIGRSGADSNTWKWSYIANECALCSSSYDNIVVDTQERVWLSGEYGKKKDPDDRYFILEDWNTDVFLPNWGQTAELLRRYTDTNSNYQIGIGSNELRISEDGYIWTAHDRVVRINANQQTLPQTVPDWATYITDLKKALLIFAVIMVSWGLWIFSWGLLLRFKDARYRKA